MRWYPNWSEALIPFEETWYGKKNSGGGPLSLDISQNGACGWCRLAADSSTHWWDFRQTHSERTVSIHLCAFKMKGVFLPKNMTDMSMVQLRLHGKQIFMFMTEVVCCVRTSCDDLGWTGQIVFSELSDVCVSHWSCLRMGLQQQLRVFLSITPTQNEIFVSSAQTLGKHPRRTRSSFVNRVCFQIWRRKLGEGGSYAPCCHVVPCDKMHTILITVSTSCNILRRMFFFPRSATRNVYLGSEVDHGTVGPPNHCLSVLFPISFLLMVA